jgi:hypothetical protein
MATSGCNLYPGPILHCFYFNANNLRCASSVLMMEIPELKSKADQYTEELRNLETSSILDGDQGQKACRAIGQRIFETFKNYPGAGEDHGRQAMRYVCNQLEGADANGNLHAESVRFAWQGIGESANRQKKLRLG